MTDAEPARPPVGWRERNVPPRHAEVWVRIAGKWRRGRVRYWIPGDRGGWDVLIEADEPPDVGPWQGRYRFDPRAIVPRYGDDPPG